MTVRFDTESLAILDDAREDGESRSAALRRVLHEWKDRKVDDGARP